MCLTASTEKVKIIRSSMYVAYFSLVLYFSPGNTFLIAFKLNKKSLSNNVKKMHLIIDLIQVNAPIKVTHEKFAGVKQLQGVHIII